jgi:hypothetical protein
MPTPLKKRTSGLPTGSPSANEAHLTPIDDQTYCLICECYPDSAVGADDPTSANRLSLSAIGGPVVGCRNLALPQLVSVRHSLGIRQT